MLALSGIIHCLIVLLSNPFLYLYFFPCHLLPQTSPSAILMVHNLILSTLISRHLLWCQAMLETHEGIRPHPPSPPPFRNSQRAEEEDHKATQCVLKKKKKKRLPLPEWVGGVFVKEIFLKQVPGRCSLARVKFFSRKNVSSVPKHWAEAWRWEGAWRIEETKCLYTDLYTSLQLCKDACSGRKEGALTAGPLEAYLTPSLPWLVPTASSPP